METFFDEALEPWLDLMDFDEALELWLDVVALWLGLVVLWLDFSLLWLDLLTLLVVSRMVFEVPWVVVEL